MKRFVVVLVMVVVGGPRALGAPSTLAVAVGDCRNAQLLTGMTAFHETLKTRWRDELYAPDVVWSLLRPRAALSLEDVQRQLETAQTQYYGGPEPMKRALELSRRALIELEKMSPVLKPWATTAQALVLHGTALKGEGRLGEATEFFRRLVRIDPAVKLDPELFAPSTVQLLETVRTEHARTRKVGLQVQSAEGAQVFIDGKAFGKAPLKVELVPGTYRVSVAMRDLVSFVHLVTVPKEGSLHVDLPFEGALTSTAPLCLAAPAASAESFAQKLANAVGAEKVVMFWHEGRDGPPFYRVLVMKRGVRDREGGVQVGLDDPRPQLDELVNFIVTGQGHGIVKGGAPVDLPLATRLDVPEPVSPPAIAARPVELSQPGRASRIIGYSLLGVGGATLIAGVVVLALADPHRGRLGALTASGALPAPNDPGYPEAVDLLRVVNEGRVASWALLGAGAGATISGVLTLVLFSSRSGQRLASLNVVPSPHGAMAGVSGVF